MGIKKYLHALEHLPLHQPFVRHVSYRPWIVAQNQRSNHFLLLRIHRDIHCHILVLGSFKDKKVLIIFTLVGLKGTFCQLAFHCHDVI